MRSAPRGDSLSWQLLEVRKAGDVNPLKQYVWSARYVDSPVVRFRDSDTSGSAVIQIDVKTGKKKVIAFLNGFIRDKEKYNLGGTFGTALSPDGQILHICWNGRPLDKQVSKGSSSSLGFGLCSVLNVHIPASERHSTFLEK